MTRRTQPYGSWPSPVTLDLLTAGGTEIAEVRVDGDDVYWHERRPAEAGRGVVVRHVPGAAPVDAIPRDADAKSRVHEYGGGAYTVASGVVFYVDDARDQRVHRVDPGAAPHPLTPPPAAGRARRYADLEVLPGAEVLIAVEEAHEGRGEPANRLVAVSAGGGRPPRVVAEGRDFFAAPRVSPDGARLAWITWDHPHMPWDASALWVGDLAPDGSLSGVRCVAGDAAGGGSAESLLQPLWAHDGTLYVLSDRSGFWNLHAVRGDRLDPVAPIEAEMAHPPWVFAIATVAARADGRLACAYRTREGWQLGLVDPAARRIEHVALPYTSFGRAPRLVTDARDRHVVVAASPARPPEVVRVTPGAPVACEVLHASASTPLDAAHVSTPEPVTFPTEGERTAHAFFYPPRHAEVEGPDGERPPLVVCVHGGPTSSTSTALSLEIQFWTTRGIAVVDVDYGGSSGYGRAYRERLRGGWGVVDVADCVAAARHLAREGRVDGARMAMTGGSAGGYTTLAALAFHDVFAAGVSRYGIADLELLAEETHKFESRYNDFLLGPYPETRALWRERSPIHAIDRIRCPLLVLQGLEDRVVPADQAERLVGALEALRRPHAYLTFEGEGHGFRRAETIRRAAAAELAFLAHVFGFTPAEPLPPLEIRHAPA